MVEALDTSVSPDFTRTEFFEDSIRRLLEDKLDFVLTASPDHRNIEVVHFFDEDTAQYHAVYMALDSRNGDYLLGAFLVKPLAKFDNWQDFDSRRNSVATRHYRYHRGLRSIHQTDALPHRSSTSLIIPNVEEYHPHTTDPETVETMRTMVQEIEGLSNSAPVPAMSITPAFIRAAQIYF